MVKSFFNALFRGMGSVIGRILTYFIIGLILFALIYYGKLDPKGLLFMNVDAASIYGPSNCTSTHYRIGKQDGEGIIDTFGVTSTSYNIMWRYITFYGTENLDANSYYDFKITFINNIPTNFISNVGFHNTSSLCGNINGDYGISGFTATGKILTFRVLTGLNIVDYWQVWVDLNGGFSNHSNGISSVTLTKVDLSGSSGIIENNNNNTNTIINNNNENTQDIINNNNENTQAIIDSNKICKQFDKSSISLDNQYLDDTGSINDLTGYGISSFISITKNGTLKVLNSRSDSAAFCFYDVNKTLISCHLDNAFSSGDVVTIPNNASFFRFSILKVQNKPTYEYCSNGQEVISDGINNLNESQNTLNDFIFSRDMVSLLNFQMTVQSWADFVSNPYSELLTLPTSLLNKLVRVSNGTCSSINLGSLYGTNLVMPCLDIGSKLGSNLWTIIDILSSISICALIISKLYTTITNLITLGGENEVRKHFQFPTPMEFLASFFV